MTDPFDVLFDQFRHTAFRYEGREVYAVGGQEAEQIQAWRDHRPRSERSIRTSDWLRRVALTTAAGKEWARVRVVDWPIPEYLQWELTGLLENQAAGDRTYLIDRTDAAECPDFWLFDGGTDDAAAMFMDYSEDGEFKGFRMVRDPLVLDRLETTRQRLLTDALLLNEWLAMQGGVRV